MKALCTAAASSTAALALVAGCGSEGSSLSGGESGELDGVLTVEDAPMQLPEDFTAMTLDHASYGPPGSWMGRAEQRFIDNIESMSDGQISVTPHWMNSLLSTSETVSGLAGGIADTGMIAAAAVPSTLPDTVWAIDTYLLEVPDSPVVSQVSGAPAAIAWSLGSEEMAEELASADVEPVIPLMMSNDVSYLTCAEPVEDLSDLAGLQVRTPSAALGDEIEALGMEAVSFPGEEAYEALQRGVVDCAMFSLRDYQGFGIPEVAPYVVMDPEVSFSGYGMAWGMNPDTWEALGAEGRSIVWRAMSDLQADYALELLREDFTLMDPESDHDVDVIPMGADVRAALEEFRAERWVTQMETAPDGLDGERIGEEMREAIAEWRETSVEALGLDELPSTWPEIVDEGWTIEDIDAEAWRALLWEELFEPTTPS